jgi:hypothetical protein
LPCYPRLALLLLMPRVGADHPEVAFAFDNFAVAADFFDRCPDFHGTYPYLNR